jgi:hypothetical protein
MGLTEVPVWPAKAVIPIGLAALLVELAVEIWLQALALRRLRGVTEPASEPSDAINDR